MAAIKMDGRMLADSILEQLTTKVNVLKSFGVTPKLAIIASSTYQGESYIRSKAKACSRIGVECAIYRITPEMAHYDIISMINDLNNDGSVHGIIVQLPIDGYFNQSAYVHSILDAIDHTKDVDGLGAYNVSELWGEDYAYFEPCTPRGIVTLLKHYHGDLTGKHAVILGRSILVGKPLTAMLLNEDCTVTVCHSYSKKLMHHATNADILVTAMGNPNLITNLPHGLGTLVDVSINKDEFGKLVGDIPKYLHDRFQYYTPVPGGVGPMTVAMLMENVVDAAENSIL